MYEKEIKTMFDAMDKYPILGITLRVIVLILFLGAGLAGAFCLFAFGLSLLPIENLQNAF